MRARTRPKGKQLPVGSHIANERWIGHKTGGKVASNQRAEDEDEEWDDHEEEEGEEEEGEEEGDDKEWDDSPMRSGTGEGYRKRTPRGERNIGSRRVSRTLLARRSEEPKLEQNP